MSRLKWVGLYLGIGLILVFVLPSPYDLISIFGLFILINFLRVRGFMKGYGGISKLRDVLGSPFSSTSGNDQRRPLKYYCMNCGKEHNLYYTYFARESGPSYTRLISFFSIATAIVLPVGLASNTLGLAAIFVATLLPS
jgi:hypothetical protein